MTTDPTAPLIAQIISQVRVDLTGVHAEICKLQGLDPTTHSWSDWSSPANTLRWFDKIEADLKATLTAQGGDLGCGITEKVLEEQIYAIICEHLDREKSGHAGEFGIRGAAKEIARLKRKLIFRLIKDANEEVQRADAAALRLPASDAQGANEEEPKAALLKCACGRPVSFDGCEPRETVLCKCGRGHVVPDANQPTIYGHWLIEHCILPIPVRNCDWQFWHKDFDGPEDDRCGHGPSIIDCMNQIDDIEDERFDCQCSAADPCGCMRAGRCDWRDDQKSRLNARSALRPDSDAQPEKERGE